MMTHQIYMTRKFLIERQAQVAAAICALDALIGKPQESPQEPEPSRLKARKQARKR